VMIVAITARQWAALVGALSLEADIEALESTLGVRFAERGRRPISISEELNSMVQAAIGGRRLAELAATFDSRGVCWSRYQTLGQAVASEPFFGEANPMLAPLEHQAADI